MLNCRHTTQLISDGVDRPLTGAERLRLGAHLLGCPACQRFRRAARWLHGALASAPAEARLPAEARDRIGQALERAARDE